MIGELYEKSSSGSTFYKHVVNLDFDPAHRKLNIMAIQSNYDWEPAPAGGASWIKPLMIIAVIFSFGLHLGLYTWFQKIVIPADEAPTRSAIENLKEFKIRGVISEEPEKKEPMSLDEAEKANLNNVNAQDLLKQVEDPFKIPESGIRLRPGEEDKPFVKTQSEQKEMTALLEQEAQQMRDELNAIAKSSLEETPIASPDQLVIGIGDQENSLLDEETLLKNYENTLAKLSNTGEVKGGQFSDLDVLLNQVGPILDQTKPILMPTDLLFEYNEDELQKGARQSLMKLGLLIQKNPRSTFIIEGHTDSTGPDDYNMELSRKRAGSVKRWLVDNLSIPEESLKIQAFGESRPLTNPNGAVEEQTLNRRVEIVILPPTD